MESVPLPPAPKISVVTLTLGPSSLLVDVHGLEELPASTETISCLWLHHPRLQTRAYMADIAARCISAWNERQEETKSKRGLIALAWDQPNHGSRLTDPKKNDSWREGNETHAEDMFASIVQMVRDQKGLLDSIDALLAEKAPGKKADQHLALGVSLGGHSVWQTMFAEPRVTAGVVIVGCPDYMNLLTDRARLTKLSTYTVDSGASFLGSQHFPTSLVQSCLENDPKGIFFGTSPVPDTSVPADAKAHKILHDRLRGKKFLLCSGGADKLVPYRCAEPFLTWFKQLTGNWYPEEGVLVDDRVYEGVGHSFSADMVRDSVRFVLEVMSEAEKSAARGASPSKI